MEPRGDSTYVFLPGRLAVPSGPGIPVRTDVVAVLVQDPEASARADQRAFAGREVALAAADAVAGAAPAQSAAWFFVLRAAVRFGAVRPDQLVLEVE